TWTEFAPWTIVEANYKWYARLKFLKTAIRTLDSIGLKE
ncbi:MAG: UDP-galactose-lipid carrier transferase, partial [Verrucomicrobia bacterium]|nr:UDP-galactose-lipid carrier transferase [Verrucomicrobiota bacterium]